ncbi:MAG TPA: sugar nucleotide-binding protein [Rhodoferax sp.]|nr:sugar nucleotide-binding protein [Rhodoferax sp.]
MTNHTVLILGSRGRFGLAAARAFAAAGWRVLGQLRPEAAVPTDPMIEWLPIDLNDTATLTRAAQGVSVVVHALNPAYTNQAWQSQGPAMMDAAIALCRLLGATLMLPGNIYNFGATMPPVLREGTPQAAHTVLGQVRIALEAQMQAIGVRGVVIRSGDFFGGGRGTWFDLSISKDLRKGALTYPGPMGVSTSWAYLPDLARTFVAVAERRAQLQPFEVYHFAGHVLTGQRWLDLLNPIARAQGWVRPDEQLRWKSMPWSVIRLGAWVVPTWVSLLEMRYLWNTPHALANDKLCALIGKEPHTPLAQALEQSLADLGLLGAHHASAIPVLAQSPR